MKHWKAGEEKKDEGGCDFERPPVCPPDPRPQEPKVEKRATVVREYECGNIPAPGQGAVSITSGSPCISVTQLSANAYEISADFCDSGGADFDSCGISIENGIVQQFERPVMQVTSTNGTVLVQQTSCGVDLSVSGETAALPFRILCASGPCADAGKAIGIVRVVRVGSQFQLEGCALAGEGAINADMPVPNTLFNTLADAVSAMNGVVLSAQWGSCGGAG